MKWDLMIAQLAQPVSSKEGAREYQRLMSDLWRHTEDREQEELVSDRGKDSFESLMGFSFVRGSSKKSDRVGDSVGDSGAMLLKTEREF